MAGPNKQTIAKIKSAGLLKLYTEEQLALLQRFGQKTTTFNPDRDDPAKDIMMWSAGFVGAFSLGGFGVSAFAGLGAAGAGIGTRVGAAIAVTAVGAISDSAVAARLGANSPLGLEGGDSRSWTSYQSGGFWGGVAQWAFQVIAPFAGDWWPWGGPSTGGGPGLMNAQDPMQSSGTGWTSFFGLVE